MNESRKTYNHAFDIAFEVPGSTHKEGEDVTADQIRKALIERANISDAELLESTGCPFDSYEEPLQQGEQALFIPDVEPSQPLTPTCNSCGSQTIIREALAMYNPAARQWELSSIGKHTFCGECGDNAQEGGAKGWEMQRVKALCP